MLKQTTTASNISGMKAAAVPAVTTTNGTATAQPRMCGTWQFALSEQLTAAVAGLALWGCFVVAASGSLTDGRAWHVPTAFLARGDWKAALAGCLAPRLWLQIVAALASVCVLFASRYIRLRGFSRTALFDLNQNRVNRLSPLGEALACLPLVEIIGICALGPSAYTDAVPLLVLFALFTIGFTVIAGGALCIGVIARMLGPNVSKQPPLGDWLAGAALILWQLVLFPILGKLWVGGFKP